MAVPDALAQLKDIHMPEPIGWWPLAFGWYLLAGFIICIFMGAYWLFRRRKQHAFVKKHALTLLKQYQTEYEQHQDTQLTCMWINELLKQVALNYFPKSEVIALHGNAWIHFLNQTGKNSDFTSIQHMLLEYPFKPSKTIDLGPLIIQTERWIKQRRTLCSN